jgi:hypothetical protein
MGSAPDLAREVAPGVQGETVINFISDLLGGKGFIRKIENLYQ